MPHPIEMPAGNEPVPDGMLDQARKELANVAKVSIEEQAVAADYIEIRGLGHSHSTAESTSWLNLCNRTTASQLGLTQRELIYRPGRDLGQEIWQKLLKSFS